MKLKLKRMENLLRKVKREVVAVRRRRVLQKAKKRIRKKEKVKAKAKVKVNHRKRKLRPEITTQMLNDESFCVQYFSSSSFSLLKWD